MDFDNRARVLRPLSADSGADAATPRHHVKSRRCRSAGSSFFPGLPLPLFCSCGIHSRSLVSGLRSGTSDRRLFLRRQSPAGRPGCAGRRVGQRHPRLASLDGRHACRGHAVVKPAACGVVASLSIVAACGPDENNQPTGVKPIYNENTNRLEQLMYDSG